MGNMAIVRFGPSGKTGRESEGRTGGKRTHRNGERFDGNE